MLHERWGALAQMEQNQQINKRAQKESLLLQMCCLGTLKYGKYTRFVVAGRKDKKFFQVSPFSKT